MPQFFRKQPPSSPHHGPRAGGQAPSLLLLHYTGMQSAAAAIERLCDPASEVSAHYVIAESGEIHSLVPEDRRAWHAGKSYWAGETDINSASIGIEIVNPGHEFGYRDFPGHQITSLIRLARGIVNRYAIHPARVLGHSDVAPGRKTDPGELFPWERLAREGVGLWPAPIEADYETVMDIKALLVEYGYNPECDGAVLLREFHRHFYPERLDEPADSESIARLRSLIRQARGRRS